MKEFNTIIPSLTASSVKDITSKLGIHKEKEKNETNKNFTKRNRIILQEWYSKRSKIKWHNKLLFKIALPTIVGLIFFILKHRTDISNEQLQKEIISTKNELRHLERDNKSIKTILQRMEDKNYEKYNLLKEYFPNGYFVYSNYNEGNPYIIRYPGKWMIDPQEFFFTNIDGVWYVEYTLKSISSEDLGFEVGPYVSATPRKIDLNNFYNLQDISFFEISGKKLGLVLLDRNHQYPTFAVGITNK